jgi:catechol 2,3-dioxygenase-like lactoylglutathione lyase family enzyme
MPHQTDSAPPGSSRPGRGPALAILATAPRPGLVLQGACPPLRPAEAAALQTAWLKGIAQELPGAAVVLFGAPADALPMLRYFAGPGVELREWRARGDARGQIDPFSAAALELFEVGHAPVLVRTADAPEPTTADLLGCLVAAAAGEFVWAPDQRGEPWLVGLPTPVHAAALHNAHRRAAELPAALLALGLPAAVRRGPWTRTVLDDTDLTMLLHERTPAAGDPTLPVQDLQAALQFYEHAFGTELLSRDDRQATVRGPGFTVRLRQVGPGGRRNGLWLPCNDPRAAAAALDGRAPIAELDLPQDLAGGGCDFTATDLDGNRLTFGTVRGSR